MTTASSYPAGLYRSRALLLSLVLLSLAACGDNGGTTSGGRVTYSVDGVVNNLTADGLVLELNGGNDAQIAPLAMGFQFSAGLADGQGWAVTVKSNPATEHCSVSPASGTVASANVVGITVNCVQNQYTLSGSIAVVPDGPLGQGLVLTDTFNHGSVQVTDPNARTYTIYTVDSGLSNGTKYNVSATATLSNPTQNCTVQAASNVISGANATGINVTCTTQSYQVGGTVAGLASIQGPLTLAYVVNGQTVQTQPVTANGAWAFPNAVLSGTAGTVVVQAQPTALNQNCTFSNGQTSLAVPKVADSSVTNIQVTCGLVSYGAAAAVSGLPASASYNVVLDLAVTDIYGKQQQGKAIGTTNTSQSSTTPFNCGASACSIPDGSTYQVTIEQPTVTNLLIPEHCVVMNAGSSGVVAEGAIAVQVQCAPVGRFLYVTADNNSTSPGTIVPYKIDPQSGALTANGAVVATGTGPGNLSLLPGSEAQNPNNPPATPTYAYLTNFQTSTLSQYAISNSSGVITPLTPASVSTAAGPWGFALPFSGQSVFVTDNIGSQIQTFQIDSGGTVSLASSYATGAGANPWGNLTFSPNGQFAYQVNDTGNNIVAYSVSAGALTAIANPVSPLVGLYEPLFLTIEPQGRFAYLLTNSSVPTTQAFAPNTPPGLLSYQITSSGQLQQIGGVVTSDTGVANSPFAYGPVVVDPSATYVFVLNYYDSSLSAYQIGADGSLTTAAGSPFQPGYWLQPTSLVVDRSGKFIYVLGSGSNNVAAYAVNLNPATGASALSLIGLYPTGGVTGQASLVVDPSGKFLYVGNHGSNSVSGFYIDANSGVLTAINGSPFGLPSGSADPGSITVLP